jgi:hypothetical protein
MSFSQIIIGVDVSMFGLCLVSVSMTMLHSLKWKLD